MPRKKEPEPIDPLKVIEEVGETDSSRVLTQKMKIALIAHFVNAVPIERLGLSPQQKDFVAIVDHVYWLLKKNPFMDAHAMFYEMCKEKYSTKASRGRAFAMSKVFERMLDFVVDSVRPDSRRRDEMKVRYAADKLMERGLASDNDRALAKGAELLTKVARLDQPESEQADMSRVAFLPPVVTTNVSEVDDTKEYIDDEQSLAIMREFGAYIDEKRTMVEERVAVLEAKSATSSEE